MVGKGTVAAWKEKPSYTLIARQVNTDLKESWRSEPNHKPSNFWTASKRGDLAALSKKQSAK
jgi:hypothetical protein